MEKIVRVFRPWLDAHPEVEVYYTEQTGWVCYSCFDGQPIFREHLNRQELLVILAVWFFDQTTDLTWAGATLQAARDMKPYLDQLSREDADTALSAIALFLQFDEERNPRHYPAPS